MSKDQVLDRLMDAFRDKGYEGTSFSELSDATGLTKSSFYHYFPGGKEEMAEAVLAHLEQQLEAALFQPLRSAHAPTKKLSAMIDTIDAFYEGGRKACLLERMCTAANRSRFRRPLQKAFSVWMDAVELLCIEAGFSRLISRARAEDFVVRVEGALVVCAGTNDYSIFARTLKDLRRSVLAEES
jgi:AcrR family transcriptional regulator